MTIHTGTYDYHRTFYTGTATQPDALNIFIKPKKEATSFQTYSAFPLANWIGMIPIASVFTGIARIVNAVKEIFRLFSNPKTATHKSELWNAYKNIFRGFVEVIPFTGIALILFESIRNTVYVLRINRELKEQENIAGVAIDGKVVVTITLDKYLEKIGHNMMLLNNQTPKYRLAAFKDLCLQFLKKAEEKNHKIGMNELFPKLLKL